jgi:hypothetical protein
MIGDKRNTEALDVPAHFCSSGKRSAHPKYEDAQIIKK